MQLDDNMEDEDVQEGWELWEPDPVDADPNKVGGLLELCYTSKF